MKSIVFLIAVIALYGANKSFEIPDRVQRPLDKRQADQKKSKGDADFIGLTVAKAKRLAKARGLLFRAAFIDGKAQLLDDDHQPKRVNVTIVKGRITKTYRG